MLVVPSSFSFPSLIRVFRILSHRTWLLFGLIWLGCSQIANAQTFNVPATSTTGYFTISWSGAGSYAIIDELMSNNTWNPIGSNGSTGYLNIGRPSGTHTYRMRACSTATNPHVCTQSGSAKSIIVNVPGATVTASFTPTSVGPGESATFTWSSTNAVRCSSSNSTQVVGTSGSFLYTVPANFTQNQIMIVVMCYTGNMGHPGGAGPVLRIGLPTLYQYDDLGRVKEVKYGGNGTNSYQYDAADNRTKKTVTKP